MIIDPTRQRRRIREASLRQKSPDLDFRMRSRLDAPIDFQNEAVAVNDGRVGLLSAENRGLEFGMRLAPGSAKRPVMRSSEFSQPSAKAPPSRDSAQERIAKRRIPDRAVENAIAVIRRAHAPHRHAGHPGLHLLTA